MTKLKDILSEARRLSEVSNTWSDLSNALFDPMDGLVAKSFPDSSERKEFRKSDTYEQLHKLVEKKMQSTGVIAGSEPTKSGRFVLRLPRSLHAALEREASNEGTSLNQLLLAKLAASLGSLVGGGKATLIQAFAEVRNSLSADRVVADPVLDRSFLRRCRELGLTGTDYDLNWSLLNARKAGLMSDLPRTRRFSIRNTDEFEYASELAVRHLQLTKGASLDQVICDPDLAQTFDDFAMRLAPGFTPLDYRWVALSLRKAGRLQQQKKGEKVTVPTLKPLGSVRRLKASSIPQGDGLYLFSSDGKPVFLSQTEKLRHRLERHMEVSESRGLPKWLWDSGPLDISLAETPGILRASRQFAELLLVKELSPVLNLQRAA